MKNLNDTDKYFKTDEEVEKFEEGGGINAGEENQDDRQKPYVAAAETCNSLDTLVPSSMAIDQERFNLGFRALIQKQYGKTVDEYVAWKLKYRSVAELCEGEIVNWLETDAEKRYIKTVRFAKEQIDAIAISIYNYEVNGNAIVIADQTGVGKGRQAAGLLRYACLNPDKFDVKRLVPIFLTEKKHLINDIYRDLIDIGFDAGLPIKRLITEKRDVEDISEDEVVKIILEDIKRDDLRVEYSMPKNEKDETLSLSVLGDYLRGTLSESSPNYEACEQVEDELIELYRLHIIENGLVSTFYEPIPEPEYNTWAMEARRRGLYVVKPYFPSFSGGLDVKDRFGNIIYEMPTTQEERRILKYIQKGKKWEENVNLTPNDFELPSDYMIICTPYTQISHGFKEVDGASVLKSKVKLIQKYANKGCLVMDESHNAAGTKKGGGKMSIAAEFSFAMVRSAKMITYISATFAKRPEQMPLYSLRTSIREAGLTDRELIEAFSSGGRALQEAVSSELTRNGQLVRREKAIRGETIYKYEREESQTGQTQISKMNLIGQLFEEIRGVDATVRGLVKAYKKQLPEVLTDEERAAGRLAKNDVKQNRTIKALSLQLFSFALLGLKVDQALVQIIGGKDENGEIVKGTLGSGKKTVVTVANTMESAFDNLSKTFMASPVSDGYKIGDSLPNDFNQYLAYLLHYTFRWNKTEVVVNDEGLYEEKSKPVWVWNDKHELSTIIQNEVGQEYTKLLSKILSLQIGITLSPIDAIKSAIKKAGYTVEEITGRGRYVEFTEDGDVGVIRRRKASPTTAVIRQFNENEIDCLIINQSGATGVSMHAVPNEKVNIVYPPTIGEDGKEIEHPPTSLKDKKEVKARAMVVTQMEFDVNKEVQKLGRISRTGQVYDPEYRYIVSVLPAEKRLTALMEMKLRSLYATVSSDQQGASHLFTAEDLYSDDAIVPFNETIKSVDPMRGEISRKEEIIDYTKTLYFKPFDLQKKFYDTFTTKFNEFILEQKAKGLYTGKMAYKDYKAVTHGSFPFFIGDEKAKSSFGRSSKIEKVGVTVYKEKLDERKVATDIADRLKIGTNFISKPETWRAEAKKVLDKLVADKTETIKSYVSQIDKNLVELRADESATIEKAAKYAVLDKAIEFAEKLEETTKAIEKTGAELTKVILSRDADKAQKQIEVKNRITELQAQHDEVAKEFEPLREIFETRDEFKSLERSLRITAKEIEKLERGKKSHEDDLAEFKLRAERTREFVNNLESVFTYTEYKEEQVWIDPKTGEVSDEPFATYEKVYSEPIVLTAVDIPTDEFSFIASNIVLYYTSVSNRGSVALSGLYKDYSEEKIARGFKPIHELEKTNETYRKTWDTIVAKWDNSSKEERWIITGTLRPFVLAKENGYSGQIIKYSTNEGRVLIGIEIPNKQEDDDKGGYGSKAKKPIYEVLSERYNDDGNLNYPVYFDCNESNMNRFVLNYIYKDLLEPYYKIIRGELKREEAAPRKVRYGKTYAFQISSRYEKIWVLISLSNALVDEITELAELAEQSEKGESVILAEIREADGLAEFLNVNIVSDFVMGTDYFAAIIEQNKIASIYSGIYKVTKESEVFEDIQPEEGSSRTGITTNIMMDGLFQDILPTNILEVKNVLQSNWRDEVMFKFSWAGKLSLTYAEFSSMIDALTIMNRKPTMAVGSKYVNKHCSDLTYELYADEMVGKITAHGEEVEAITAETQISNLIDELVGLLTL